MKIKGLTSREVDEQRKLYGSNQLSEKKREGFFAKLWGNFQDPMIRILLVALVINVVFAILGYCGVIPQKVLWYEPVGIAAAVLIATLVSTFSEFKNENTFAKLQEESSRILCKVYRDGSIVNIPIDEIVVGDYVVVQTGDMIPADGYVVEGTLRVNQATLNGESADATKNPVGEGYTFDKESTDLLDPNKVFRGTLVSSGNAVICIALVGDSTEYGKIASELQEDDDRETPLKHKLSKLANQISLFGYIGAAAIAVAFIFCRFFIDNHFNGSEIGSYFSTWSNPVTDLVEAVVLAVIIIVMAVPEGLPLMIAIVSSQNMGKMLKDNVLVRKVSGIETAGSLNILFTDKTGTITKGHLEVTTFVSGDLSSFAKYDDIPEAIKNFVYLGARYNTNAFVDEKEGGSRTVLGGNATDRAMLGYISHALLEKNINVVRSIPFNSAYKYAATQIEGDAAITLVTGAPEKVLVKCSKYLNKDGKEEALNLQEAEKVILELANKSIRVVALATTDAKISDDVELPEGNYRLIGLIGIRDEIRPTSRPAIEEVHKAGVQVVMITGDRRETAKAIAIESGIIESEDDLILTSDEIAKMSDDELKAQIRKIKVVARALPTDKSRLIKVAQELDLVVGMTGDGVNDSPALKKADVGFAMGSGTEVAKEASEVVIMDDDFTSIQKAVLYGRTIFNSIRKFIIFQLTINVGAVLISFVCPLIGVENPLSVTQILWVNLVMDTLAALAFGGEPALKEYMHEEPKKRSEHIISKYMWSEIIVAGLWTFAMGMLLLFLPAIKGLFRMPDMTVVVDGVDTVVPDTRFLLTGYFTFFILSAVFNAFNARTTKINLFDNIIKNKGFFIILGIIVVVQVLLTYFGGVIFNGWGLNWKEWLIVLGLAISVIPVDIIRKAIAKAIASGKNKKA